MEIGATVSPAGVSGKLVTPVVSPGNGMTTALELRNASKISPTSVPQNCAVLPSESWLQVCSANATLLLFRYILLLILHEMLS